jgi:hypothetical protein
MSEPTGGNIDLEDLKGWLDKKFALSRLDNAIVVLSSSTTIIFTLGTTFSGKGIAFYLVPLFFITWAMPLWSGYYLGAIIRNNLPDRMRGWVYLLAGASSYLLFPLVGLYLPLWGPEQVNPSNFLIGISMFIVFECLVTSISVLVSLKIIPILFRSLSTSDHKTKLYQKSMLLTSIAIALFAGSIGSYQIWTALGSSVQLSLVTSITFLLGFVFEYMALRITRSS